MNSIKELLKTQGYLTRKQIKKYADENELDYNLVLKILKDIGINFIHIDSKELNVEYERCVLCGKETNVKKNEEIEHRDFYIYGVGQLCSACYKETNL